MQITDRIYGTVTMTEPVLTGLLASTALDRLKGVSQHGISAVIGLTSPLSRYEHSVGAMLLVRRLGASLEEQIAALLHDVSHTAFSHVIDYVFGDHNDQSYHERVKESMIVQTDVPAILHAHGYDWRDFLDETPYTLLEQPAPALCADRVDYFLRDCIDLRLGTAPQVQHALDHLVAWQGRIVTDNAAVARWMGYTYIAADNKSWANFREVALYELCARAIRTGLDTGAISEDDFWGDDVSLWNKLNASANADLRAQVGLVSLDTRVVWDESAPDFRVGTKIRTIDPDVLTTGRAQPVSALDAEFDAYRTEYLDRKAGVWPVRIIPAR